MAKQLREGRKPTLSSLEALALLRAHLAEEHNETAPPGFKSVEEWATEWRLSRPRTDTLLREAVRIGRAERRVLKRGRHKLGFYRMSI